MREEEEEKKFKINLDYRISINSNIKTKEEPLSKLLNDYSEVKSILKFDKLTKFLFHNKNAVHLILNDNDKIIYIHETMQNDLFSNFYLFLLIRDQEFIINYQISFKYIQTFNKFKTNENNKIYNIIKAKIIIEFINNNADCGLGDDVEQDTSSKLLKENKDYIENNINYFKQIIPEIDLDDIINLNMDELYCKITISLIKQNKFCDYDFTFDIIKQLDLQNIDIPFLESENLFEQILEALDQKNDYVKNYIFYSSNDLKNRKKINFYFSLLKYVFKNPIYIYNIPFLLHANQKIIEFIKSKELLSLTLEDEIMKERILFVIQKLCNLDYYSKYINDNIFIKNENLSKSSSNYIREENRNIIFYQGDEKIVKKKGYIKNNDIKDEILNHSRFIISFTNNDKEKLITDKINIIYGKDKNKITFNALLQLNIKNNNFENNTNLSISPLNLNFNKFLQFLNQLFSRLNKIIQENKIHHEIQLILEFENNNNKDNLNVKYIFPISNNDIFQINDENILMKDLNDLMGLKEFSNKLITNKKYIPLDEMSTLFDSLTKTSSFLNNGLLNNNKNSDINNKSINDINLDIKEDENYYQIIKIIEKIEKRQDSIKSLLSLKYGYFLSYSNDNEILLFNEEMTFIKTLKNFDSIIFNISQIDTGENKIIELIVCSPIHIYLISIDLEKNFNIEYKKYEVPKTIILSARQIKNNYLLAGVNTLMNVKDLFNDNLDQKKMVKLTNISFKIGCVINNHAVLFSNELIPGGINQLNIFDLENNSSIYSITDISPNMSENSVSLMELNDSEKRVLCACKKYKKNSGKNEILIVGVSQIKETDKMEIRHKIFDTDNYEVNCFCQIKIKLKETGEFQNSLFFFAGCFDKSRHLGVVKLFKFKDEKSLNIRFLQDIENFGRFEMPVNTIIQCQKTGRIIITTTDGEIYLYSQPNLNLYMNLRRKNKVIKIQDT